MDVADDSNVIEGVFAQSDARAARQITIRADALHLIADEAEEALIDAQAPIYVRSGQLVRPVVDEMPSYHGKRTRVARLWKLDADSLLDHLSRAARWTKFDGRGGGKMKPADVPRAVAQTILSRVGEWAFLRLSGVTMTPTLRPDGSLLLEPGYDPATQLLLIDPPKMPAIKERPTRHDALLALATLNELLDEFPFVDEASRSVALSALITPVARGAMTAVPMHAITAPVPGSGKSYIIDLASSVSTGALAAVLTAAERDEETEKRLDAALLNGQPIITIDNVNGDLGGDKLCQIIERPVVGVRPLGGSVQVDVENRACIFATGNNINLVGDMTRRVVLCSLDPNVERPELRAFRGDPLELVRADRGKYIAAALTICRAYAVAGYPNQCRPLASFGEWSKIVRSALVWLDQPDPVSTMEAARANDPITATLTLILAAWHKAVGEVWKSTAEIVRDATSKVFESYAHPELVEALKEVAKDRYGEIDVGRLGKYLGKHKGRIFGGFKLNVDEDAHDHKKIWSVTKV